MDQPQNCRRDSLANKDSRRRYEVTNLEPCQLWHFRLRTAPTIVEGMITLGQILWTFEATTVPVPHVQVIAGTVIDEKPSHLCVGHLERLRL